MTVAELGRRMSSAEYAAWMAFDRIHPIGARRHDLLTAQLCLVVAAALGAKHVDLTTFDLFGASRLNIEAPAGSIEPLKPRRSLYMRKLDAIRATKALGGTVIKRGSQRGDDRQT